MAIGNMKMGAMKGMGMSRMKVDGMKVMDISGRKVPGDSSSSGAAMPVVTDSQVPGIQTMRGVGVTPFPQSGPDTTRTVGMGKQTL